MGGWVYVAMGGRYGEVTCVWGYGGVGIWGCEVYEGYWDMGGWVYVAMGGRYGVYGDLCGFEAVGVGSMDIWIYGDMGCVSLWGFA